MLNINILEPWSGFTKYSHTVTTKAMVLYLNIYNTFTETTLVKYINIYIHILYI